MRNYPKSRRCLAVFGDSVWTKISKSPGTVFSAVAVWACSPSARARPRRACADRLKHGARRPSPLNSGASRHTVFDGMSHSSVKNSMSTGPIQAKSPSRLPPRGDFGSKPRSQHLFRGAGVELVPAMRHFCLNALDGTSGRFFSSQAESKAKS